jgi:hypothetical protein
MDFANSEQRLQDEVAFLNGEILFCLILIYSEESLFVVFHATFDI